MQKVEQSLIIQRSAFSVPALNLRSAILLLQYTIGGALFVVLCTANAGGYRYGVSDQAFYIPVVMRALDPVLFPRDGALIDAEGRLMVMDEMLAALVRGTGLSIETVFLLSYLASLILIWTAVLLIGTRLYSSPWAVAALVAAVTLRHRIPRTSVNSLEPYFHPRMLAFGLGTLAVAAVLRKRPWTAILLVAAAAPVHITTALWFAVLAGVAIPVMDPRWRRMAVLGGASAACVLVLAVLAGPLRGSLTVMDATWQQAVAAKDSLFATEWPMWAWAANLGSAAVLWWAYRTRSVRGLSTVEDRGLVWGALALVALFLVTLPFVAAAMSLAVQFQISRVFWLVEFVALVYVIAALAGHPADRPRTSMRERRASRYARAPLAVALVLLAFATARGTYVMLFEHPGRPLFELQLPDSSWGDAMRWMADRPPEVHVLADPGHAWKYGSSVRVAAGRDVLLEEVKDSALAIYSRDVAARVVERTTAIDDFGALTADRARMLAGRYALDYLVTEADLPLSLAYQNDRFRIYALR